MVVLKCRLAADTRRIRLDSLTYEQLVTDILPKMFNEEIPKWNITYRDPENDTVFITNDLELNEALLLCPEVLVLNLMQKDAKPKEIEEEPQTFPMEVQNSPEKRKVDEEDRSPSPSKRQKLDATAKSPRPNYNYTPVRVMVIEALKHLTQGGTIHDIMDFVNENFPVEAKNIKDLHKAIQGRLSSRKEFLKASFKKLDKLTKKECTVWTLSTQAGTKKVTRPHKGRRQDTRVKYDEEPAWDDEEEEDEDDEESSDHEDIPTTPSVKDVNYMELVVEALRALGGKGTIKDIREWLTEQYVEPWATRSYKLHRILSDNPRFEEEIDQVNGIKIFHLAEFGGRRSPDRADNFHEQHKDLFLLSEASRELISLGDSNPAIIPNNSPIGAESAANALAATVNNNAV